MKLLFGDWKDGKDLGILILRAVFGLILLFGHGIGKLNVIFTGQEIQFMDPIGLGANLSFYLVLFAEVVCAILLILGLFTRASAAVLTFTFLVVLFVHFNDGFAVLEMRLFYLFSFIALMITGGGKFSLDQMLFNKK